jgi:hypothetical protein
MELVAIDALQSWDIYPSCLPLDWPLGRKTSGYPYTRLILKLGLALLVRSHNSKNLVIALPSFFHLHVISSEASSICAY